MKRLRIQFLGGFELYDHNDVPLRLPSRNGAALLAILAVGRTRMQGRAKLASLLWDSRDFEHARGSLRQTLFMLRRFLGREAMREQTDALRLDEAVVRTDLWDFLDLVAQGTPEALSGAVELFQGEFLDGHPTNRSNAFDEWLTNERQRLRDLALQTFCHSLDHAMRHGAHEDVRRTALRMLALDPAEETAHRALMQVHASEQRFSLALRQFDLCRRVLQSELNVEPDAQTRQLYADIMLSRSSRFPLALRSSADTATGNVRKLA